MENAIRKQSGFTLIELMIVVAIIGILASVAVPAYRDYITKSRVTEGLSLATTAKVNVSENVAVSAADLSVGWTPPAATPTVSSVGMDALGIITVTYDATMVPGGGTIVLTPTIDANGQVTWACTTTLTPKYAPASCR